MNYLAKGILLLTFTKKEGRIIIPVIRIPVIRISGIIIPGIRIPGIITRNNTQE